MFTILSGCISKIEKQQVKRIAPKEIFYRLWKSLFTNGGLLLVLQMFKNVEKTITSKCCNMGINKCTTCLNNFLESTKEITINFKKYAFITIASSDNPRMLIAISFFCYKGIDLYGNIEYCSKELLELLNELKDKNYRYVKRSTHGNIIKYGDFEFNEVFNLFETKNELISMLLHYYICIRLCYMRNTELLFTNYRTSLNDYYKLSYRFIDNLYNLLRREKNIFLDTRFKNVLQEYCNEMVRSKLLPSNGLSNKEVTKERNNKEVTKEQNNK